MIWDRLFWLWFAVTAALALYLLYEEPTAYSMFLSSMLIGLGLLKLACERSREGRSMVSRRLIGRLRKRHT
jgi:hypothetical protein